MPTKTEVNGWSGRAPGICALNRARATELMERVGYEALVLSEPEAVHYATGVAIPAAGLFRRAGASFVLVPRCADLPLGLVVTDYDAGMFSAKAPEAIIHTHPAWIELVGLDANPDSGVLEQRVEAALAGLGRPAEFNRPATFDLTRASEELARLMTRVGIARGRVGMDLGFVSAIDLAVVRSHLDPHEVADATHVLDRLRSIKSEAEISLLRRGIEFSEAGLTHMLHNALTGMRQAELVALYRRGVEEASRGSPYAVTTKEYVFIGERERSPPEPSRRGDPVKADMVCVVDGYAADMSRNFVFGCATVDQQRLHEIAEQAFTRGASELVPGNTLGRVYQAVSDSLALQGLPSYRRGHFGHGVGNSVFSEQWPFIAAGSNVEIEPGMVLAFEVPLYVDGIARFNLEDQFVITENGAVAMNCMPRVLTVVN